MLFGHNDSIKQQLEQDAREDVTKQLVEVHSQYNKELMETGSASPNTQFNYAYWLIRSPRSEDRIKGVLMLKALHQYDPHNKDYLYYLAYGNYRLQEYVEARKCADKLLSLEPNHTQARSLKKLAEEKVTKDGMVGMAVIGGVATALIAGAVLLLKKR